MKAPFNRHVGLIVLEVNHSNPNGDPDLESDPRTLEADGRGIISPVSFKRKIRDLVLENGLAMDEAREKLSLEKNGDSNHYNILESRGRDRKEIIKLDKQAFSSQYWDARVFGNTFLESAKDDQDAKNRDLSHFISTGVIQVGVGMSISPVIIDRMTNTNKSGVQEGKDRGMAPLAFRVVRHGIYAIPYFINPSMALRNGTTQKDIDLFEFLAPVAYSQTASAVRSDVRCLHIWRGIHKSPLGSCPDHLFLEAFTPKLKSEKTEGETREDYAIPTRESVPAELLSRFDKVDDICIL
jgi:Cas7 group CRISPR-associated protein Csh2